MSETPRRGVSRRQVLTGLTIFGAGAAGGAALVNAAEPESPTLQEGRQTSGVRTSITLHGERLVSVVPGRVPGERRPPNRSAATSGELFDDSGAPVGQFSSAAVAGSAGALMLHTFELHDGTILGMGSGPLGEATFAVVGGTGRYHGVAGSYVARQHPRDLGGDGTAEFSFELTEGS